MTTLGWLPFATLTFLNLRISQGIRKLQQPKLVTPALSLNSAQCKALERKNKRHSKEIRATHLSIVIGMSIRVAPFSKLLQITLLRILVIPIGTTSYHPKNERASFHARLAKRAQSFTTIVIKRN